MLRSLFLGCIVACLSLQGALFSAAAEASPESTMTTASPSFTLGPAKTCIGQPAPAFTKAEALMPDGTFGELSLSDYNGKFVVLLFYPLDFTFVCPTELIAFSERAKEFRDIGAEVIGISVDSKFSHLAWTKLPRTKGGLGEMNIPLIADVTKHISADYGVLIPDQGVALRGLFVIDPKGTLRQITINDLPIGRDVDEALRLVQAIDFVDKHGEVCPAGWRPGKKSMKADPEGSLEYFGSLAEETATTVKKQKN